MDAAIRIRLDTGGRVVAHSKANPSDDPNHTSLVVRLEDLYKQGTALNEQALKGELAVHSSVRGKDEVKGLINQQLQAFNGVAQLASIENAGVEELVRVPKVTAAYKTYLATTRVMIDHATQHSELFKKHGLPETFVADLTALADEMEAAMGKKESSKLSHVGANADLDDVVSQMMKVIKALDRLNRVRYRKDPERLAAWKSARDVAWPAVKPEGPTPAEPAA